MEASRFWDLNSLPQAIAKKHPAAVTGHNAVERFGGGDDPSSHTEGGQGIPGMDGCWEAPCKTQEKDTAPMAM